MIEDEDLLMAVLNSTPVVDGAATEQLTGRTGGELARRFGGCETGAELAHLRETRDAIQNLIRRRDDAAGGLAEAIGAVALRPEVTPEGIEWHLETAEDLRLAARVALAWSRAVQQLPGRLRACANTECNLFLIDHSRPGTAKWCSMATCGNRMKARAHTQRLRQQR